MEATLGGGQPAHSADHGMSILRRDVDNIWRFARGINNATLQKHLELQEKRGRNMPV